MKTGAVLAVTLQDANAGDTTTIQQTLIPVAEQMEKFDRIEINSYEPSPQRGRRI